MTTDTYSQELDARGLQCPLPLLKTKLALRDLAATEVLLVKASDSGSWQDIPRYIRQSPFELLNAKEQDGEYLFYIKKKPAN